MISYDELAGIVDHLHEAYASQPFVTVSRNTHARLQAIAAHKPFAHRRRRKRPERMGRTLREQIRRQRLAHGAYWFEIMPMTAEEGERWKSKKSFLPLSSTFA